MFLKQYKGKDLDKVPASKLLEDNYYVGKKYDGNYVQIHKMGDTVTFYTSGGKEFYLDDVELDLVLNNPNTDFIVEAEYIALTVGLLGSRGQCTTTTFRTNTSKGIKNLCNNNKFKVFDILYLASTGLVMYDCTIDSDNFEERLEHFNTYNIDLGSNLDLVNWVCMSKDEALMHARHYCDIGGEGMFMFHESHTWADKGRSNLAIKLKFYPRKTLHCIGTEDGEGKYTNMIGSLILKDGKGLIVKVGSGLSDSDRAGVKEYYIGQWVEIEYEQILDTYIQPRFIRIV